MDLRLHYDNLLAEKHQASYTQKKRPGRVLSCAAFAHRKALNEKIRLPDSVKDILHCPVLLWREHRCSVCGDLAVDRQTPKRAQALPTR